MMNYSQGHHISLGSQKRLDPENCVFTFFVILAGLPLGPVAGFFYITEENI